MNVRNACAICCAIVATVALGTTCNAAKKTVNENMLAKFNPSFEEKAVGGKIPGWNKSENGVASIVSDEKHSGMNSLLLSNAILLTSEAIITVEPGYIYHMSVWGKIKNFGFIKSGRV